MALLDEMRAQKLEELARARFSAVLKKAELRVLRDSASSQDVDDPGEDAARPVVRAEFLRWLVTDAEAVACLDPKGLRVYGATISTELDLAECRELPVLDFRRCEFQGDILLRSAETKGIYIFDSSLLQDLVADGLTVHGPFYLRNSQASGEVRLLGAKISGNLDCCGTKLKAKGNALFADGAEIGGCVFLKDGFESEGEIRLHKAKILRDIDCTGAKLKAEDKALSADGAEIGGDICLDEGFESEGEIRLLGTKITGNLDCSGAKLKAKGDALIADRAEIGGSIFLADEFESEGKIRFLGAKITGSLSCTGAKLKAKGDALIADGVEIGGSVSLQRCESTGLIRFPGAVICGDLDCSGGKFADIFCQNMRLEGDFIWRAIQSSEVVWVDLSGAKVKNLRDDRMSWPVEENLLLDGLEYEELTLHEEPMQWHVDQNMHSKELPLKAEERIEWLMLQRADRIDEAQPWMQLRALLEKKGDLKGAKYVLSRYRRLQASKAVWHPLRWVMRILLVVLGFVRGLFTRIDTWKELGHFIGRVWLNLRHPNCGARKLYAVIEEEPLRILWSIGLTLAIGTSIFTWAGNKGAMMETARYQQRVVPAGSLVQTGAAATSGAGDAKSVSILYPHFQPFIYTLENAVPVIRLGMDERWMPNAGEEFCWPWFGPRGLSFISTYGLLNFTRWALIVWGWVQATVLVASLAERFKK